MHVDGIRALTIIAVLASYPVLAENEKPIPVTTKPVSEVVFFPVRSAPATAVSLNDARIGSEISGLLETILVRVGDRVNRGDIVARVDCRQAEAELTEAQAALQAGKAKLQFDGSQLQKARRLSKSKSISADEIDRRRSNASISEAEVERLEAAVARRELNVDRCEIVAPFDSVVTERLASEGDFMERGEPVLRLLDTANIELSADIQEKDVASLKSAKDLEFVTREHRFRVKLRTVLPKMDSRLRSFNARFTFSAAKAVSGRTGRLEWRNPVAHLPADLLVDRRGLGVFVQDGDKARFMRLDSAVAGLPAAIEAHLETQVVIDGRFNVQDGDPIVPVAQP
jgi:RND family efflux transporter MFP subunit